MTESDGGEVTVTGTNAQAGLPAGDRNERFRRAKCGDVPGSRAAFGPTFSHVRLQADGGGRPNAVERVGLVCGGCDIPPAFGPAQLHAIIDALPHDTPQPIANVLACPECPGFRDGLPVIVTTARPDTDGD